MHREENIGKGFLAIGCLIFVLEFLFPYRISACSSFKLQKGGELLYGHNLNQGDIGVPGLVFINKRGIFKFGRTWSEIISKNRLNPSSHCWISRYGSVTFNNFAKDFPDGGMNETGLFVWEMNADFEDYPKNDRLPKLNQMNWMQYVLDNYSTVEEAIQCAYDIEIDGWSWHFFIGDAQGNTAAIDFDDGEVVVHSGKGMPVPGLFNTPYKRELELLKYYRGFGGLYKPEMENPEVPRFVKTAVMLRDYLPGKDIVKDGFAMLDTLQVYDIPEWSILFDVRTHTVYFKTRINAEIKQISMDRIDFSNDSPVLIVNMDIRKGEDVLYKFHPYTDMKFKKFTRSSMIPAIPKVFFTHGGLTIDEYIDRTASHGNTAALPEKQFFKGVWKNKPEKNEEQRRVILKINTRGDAVFGEISFSKNGESFYLCEHIQLIGKKLTFTFRTHGGRFIELQGVIEGETMKVTLNGNRHNLGNYLLLKTLQSRN